MRNTYYPQRKAEYVTQAQMRTMDKSNMVIERDFTFGVEQTQSEAQQEDIKAVDVKMKLMTPKRACELIEALVPPELVFHRVPIATSEPEPEPPEPLGNSINAIGGELPVRRSPAPKPMVTRIFGSVSTMDILDSLKAVMAEDDEGARVVLGAESIGIKEAANEELGIEADRLKAVGNYNIEIRPRGSDPIRRIVSVRPQETGL
ncbi:MAG: hypothetical protein Q9201_002015 [Fulgogasparrea decipioides]